MKNKTMTVMGEEDIEPEILKVQSASYER